MNRDSWLCGFSEDCEWCRECFELMLKRLTKISLFSKIWKLILLLRIPGTIPDLLQDLLAL